MNNIEWKYGAVCYADCYQWFPYKDWQLKTDDENLDSLDKLLRCESFQLNEPRIGDYLPKSELDTEQKYNDAVEVLGLFGFVGLSFGYYEGIKHDCIFVNGISEVSFCTDGYPECKRKITYNQLMAIGKLKRLMNERDNLKRWGEYNGCVAVNLGDAKSAGSCAGGFSVGYECNTSEKPNGSELDNNLTISANKYEREISDRQGNSATVDVYDVLKAFEVSCPATQHAVKKLLCSGIRGHKDLSTDLIEAKESIVRAIELNG